ncbi:hypothetical protein D1872_309030 [compost metagenome]
MAGRTRVYIVGLLLILFSLLFFAASVALAVRGYIIASLIGVSSGSVALIVGADLLRES